MSQSTIIALFLFCLLANVGMWLMGGWLVVLGDWFAGPVILLGAITHGALMWLSFIAGRKDEDEQ